MDACGQAGVVLIVPLPVIDANEDRFTLIDFTTQSFASLPAPRHAYAKPLCPRLLI